MKSSRDIVSVLFLCLTTAVGAAPPFDGAAGRRERARLEEKNFDELTDRSLSARAKEALRTDGGRWRHGETEHFVFHFQRLTEAQRLAREAEFYYQKIKQDLEVEQDLLEGKSHVILFSRPDRWKQFAAEVGAPPWTVGWSAGRELFLLIEPGSPEASDRLAHEITHLVFFRFVPKPVPLWLNEGLAEYLSKAAYARLKGIGMAPRPRSNPSPPLDLEQLVAITSYPREPHEVARFYADAERLVRFLLTQHPRGQFLSFVNLLADGASFEQALLETYAARYRTLDQFKKRFERF